MLQGDQGGTPLHDLLDLALLREILIVLPILYQRE